MSTQDVDLAVLANNMKHLEKTVEEFKKLEYSAFTVQQMAKDIATHQKQINERFNKIQEQVDEMNRQVDLIIGDKNRVAGWLDAGKLAWAVGGSAFLAVATWLIKKYYEVSP